MGEGRGMEIWDAKEEKVKFESSPVRSTSNNKNKKVYGSEETGRT